MRRLLFDSSVLVAAFVASHPKHNTAHQWLNQALSGEIEYIVAAHSIIEVYSVLTRAPFKPPISPRIATKLIDQNIKRKARIVSLTKREHFQIIDRMNQLELKGGIIYDALIARCAQKAAASGIITSNAKDFIRLLPDQAIEIITI